MNLRVSPRGFLARAILIAIAFGVVHALGWREETRFISGTPSSPVAGALYLVLYMGFVLVAPVLVLGAGIFAVLERWQTSRAPSKF